MNRAAYRRLAEAIIEQTLDDVRYLHHRGIVNDKAVVVKRIPEAVRVKIPDARDLHQFIGSEYFADLCNFVGVSESLVRKNIIKEA